MLDLDCVLRLTCANLIAGVAEDKEGGEYKG